MHRTRRTALVVALPVVIAGVAVLPWVLAWSGLPDPVATHWAIGGEPDGHMSRAAAAVYTVVPALAGALVMAAVGRRAEPQGLAPGAVATGVIAAGLGGVFAVVSLTTVLANAGASSWRGAGVAVGVVVVAVLAAMAAAGLAAASALGSPRAMPAPAAGPDDPAVAPAVRVGPGERVGWVGACDVRWPLGVAAIVALVAAGSALVSLWVAALLALVPLVLLAFATVHVSVGTRGIRAACAIGWPGVSFPLAEIASVRAINLQPLRWGGWGYRGSLRLLGRAAWVLRAGEALEVRLTDGRVFAVTVDGAAEAAAVATGMLAPAP
jgi:Domain of unknown function (DUF1648)